MTPADDTCWALIHAAAAGDRAARDDFARLYEPVARAYFATRWAQSPCLGGYSFRSQSGGRVPNPARPRCCRRRVWPNGVARTDGSPV